MVRDASREAFEAWANDKGMDAATWGDYPDVFKFKSTNDAWNGWQAGREQALLDAMNAAVSFGKTGAVIAAAIGALK